MDLAHAAAVRAGEHVDGLAGLHADRDHPDHRAVLDGTIGHVPNDNTLLVDQVSRSDTYPYMEIDSDDVSIEHEARVARASEAA